MMSRPDHSLLLRMCGVAAAWILLVTSGCATSHVCDDCCGAPDTMPLGSLNEAHYQAMTAGAEASDFVVHVSDFRADSAELTSHGRERVLQIATRMSATPFSVLVEPDEFSQSPGLDESRRRLLVGVLSDLGQTDAEYRTIVSLPYSAGMAASEAIAH